MTREIYLRLQSMDKECPHSRLRRVTSQSGTKKETCLECLDCQKYFSDSPEDQRIVEHNTYTCGI